MESISNISKLFLVVSCLNLTALAHASADTAPERGTVGGPEAITWTSADKEDVSLFGMLEDWIIRCKEHYDIQGPIDLTLSSPEEVQKRRMDASNTCDYDQAAEDVYMFQQTGRLPLSKKQQKDPLAQECAAFTEGMISINNLKQIGKRQEECLSVGVDLVASGTISQDLVDGVKGFFNKARTGVASTKSLCEGYKVGLVYGQVTRLLVGAISEAIGQVMAKAVEGVGKAIGEAINVGIGSAVKAIGGNADMPGDVDMGSSNGGDLPVDSLESNQSVR